MRSHPLDTRADLRVVPAGECTPSEDRSFAARPDDDILLISETAAHYRVHTNTIRRMCDRAEIPFFTVGRGHDRRFRVGDLRTWEKRSVLSYPAVHDTRPAENAPTAAVAAANGHAQSTALRPVRSEGRAAARPERLASAKERSGRGAHVDGTNRGPGPAELAGLVLRTNGTSAGIQGSVADRI